jgi:hypothetical protein
MAGCAGLPADLPFSVIFIDFHKDPAKKRKKMAIY